MRRIITIALLALTATAGSAAADRHRGHHDRGHRVQVRDHRAPVRVQRTRDHRWNHRVQPKRRVVVRNHRHVDRRPIYVNNGRFTFRNGRTFVYRRPVITRRYFNVNVRPRVLLENYAPVPGYIWIAGHWNWNGYEWIWISGHYQIDPNYQYDDAYFYYGY